MDIENEIKDADNSGIYADIDEEKMISNMINNSNEDNIDVDTDSDQLIRNS